MFTIHHVALSVSDMIRSKEFYKNFGFRVLVDWVSENEELAISHLKLGEAILELFCYKNPTPMPNEN